MNIIKWNIKLPSSWTALIVLSLGKFSLHVFLNRLQLLSVPPIPFLVPSRFFHSLLSLTPSHFVDLHPHSQIIIPSVSFFIQPKCQTKTCVKLFSPLLGILLHFI